MNTPNGPKVLDVTLRDGGFQNDWNFSQQNAIALVSLLHDAGMDYIEIGYRNKPPIVVPNPGLSSRCDNDYVSAIKKQVPQADLSVMYLPKFVALSDIEMLADLGVSMVRGCVSPTGWEDALPLVKKGYDLGLISTANITEITERNIEEVVDTANRIIDNGCSVIYLADSNGSMTPNTVRDTFEYLKSRLAHQVELGYHNHNMLNMAMANYIEASHQGISYIDCSLRGMGRASGNVQSESLFAYKSKTYPKSRYSVPGIMRAAHYLCSQFASANPEPKLENTAMGAYNFVSTLESVIAVAANEYNITWLDLINEMYRVKLDRRHITLDTIRAVAHSMCDARQREKSTVQAARTDSEMSYFSEFDIIDSTPATAEKSREFVRND
ncbi:hypothetical protein AB833_02155 [Chromatiales bacterium (ex Bugula neritina AB1)]|nr:hypothetical protein AB833_02155 [Chromatiales bacterium (ex Bugula neritina AB1)]